MKRSTILYSLNVQDAQTVSFDIIERKLTNDELKKLIDLIPENINWYEAIEYAIYKLLNIENDEEEGRNDFGDPQK